MKKRKQTYENKRNAKENKKNQTDIKANKVEEPEQYIPTTKTYKLSIDKQTRKKLNDCIASTRKVWNKALQYIKNNPDEAISQTKLMSMFVTKKSMTLETKKEMEWTLRTPKKTREYGIIDLCSNIKSCETRKKKRQIKNYHINFKSKNDNVQTISLTKDSSKIKDNTLIVSSIRIPIKEKIEDQKINHNMRLTRRNDVFYLRITYFKSEQLQKRKSKNRIASFDPGFNAFHTYYCPDGEYGVIGSDIESKIDKIRNKMDIIKKLKIRKSNQIQHKYERRIVNVVDDFQWKLCHWMLGNFNKIVIPSLYVRKSNKKKLQSDLRHCDFVNRLIHKSIEYEDIQIHKCKEHFTSQTCTKCGSRKTIKNTIVQCRKCNFSIHRDVSGARNILLKHLQFN